MKKWKRRESKVEDSDEEKEENGKNEKFSSSKGWWRTNRDENDDDFIFHILIASAAPCPYANYTDSICVMVVSESCCLVSDDEKFCSPKDILINLN